MTSHMWALIGMAMCNAMAAVLFGVWEGEVSYSFRSKSYDKRKLPVDKKATYFRNGKFELLTDANQEY